MSIEIVSGANGAVLTDTVDGMAFGPTFEDRAEAEAFVRWLDRETGGARLSSLTADKWTADKWRAFLADHSPEQCPFDGQDQVGFLGDRDASDGSGAWTPQCQCECHERTVTA